MKASPQAWLDMPRATSVDFEFEVEDVEEKDE